MKLVVILTLLLLTAYAAPTAKEREVQKDETWRHKLAKVLSEYKKYIVEHIKNIIKEKKSKIAGALVGLTDAEDWEKEISGIFKGNAQRTVEEFFYLVQNKNSIYKNWAEYFTAETVNIISGLLMIFGAEGDDLESTSASLINVTLNKSLTIFASSLDEKEVKAISGSVSGLVKTVVKIIKDTQNWASPIADYIKNEIVDLVDVGLKRLLGENSKIYKFISTFL
uniref:Uncharacterized protein n=1 Tax=Schistocephalus solidus TaxID=70667 RepID=A0A0X3PD23_SCHSO